MSDMTGSQRGMLLALLLVAATLVTPVAAQTVCDSADASRRARLFDQAQAQYVALLTADPTQRCATVGLDQIAAERAEADRALARGQGFEAAGLKERARAAYVEALAIDPSLEPAQTKLDGLLGPPPTASPSPSPSAEMAAAQRLAEIGMVDEAKEKLKEALDEDPGTDVPPDLVRLVGGVWPGWGARQAEIEATVRMASAFLLDLAVLLSVVFVICFVIRALWRLIPAFRLPPRLKIEPFDKGATSLDVGQALAAQIEDALTQHDEHGPRPLVHLVSGPTMAFQMPTEVSTFAPVLNALLAVADFVDQREQVTLTGHLHAPGARGAGLTVSLAKSGKIFASTTLWLDQYRPARSASAPASRAATSTAASAGSSSATAPKAEATDYYLLTNLAACWMLFQLGKQWPRMFIRPTTISAVPVEAARTARPAGATWQNFSWSRWGVRVALLIARLVFFTVLLIVVFPFIPALIGVAVVRAIARAARPDTTLGSPPEFDLLGTHDWESYTFYQAGVNWSLNDDEKNARIAYVEALHRDPTNLAAAINLGVLFLNQAVERLEEDGPKLDAFDMAERQLTWATSRLEGDHDNNCDPALRYVACFQLAALYEYRSRLHPLIKKEEDPFKSAARSQDLKRAIHVSHLLRDAIDRDLQEAIPLPRRFNLFQRERRRNLKQYADNRRAYLESIAPMVQLVYAVHLSYGDESGEVPPADMEQRRRDAEWIVGRIEEEQLSYRAHYNLACYYSVCGEREAGEKQRSECYKKALSHLEEALVQGGQIVAWSKTDLSLCGVRGDKRWLHAGRATPSEISEKFKKVVARYDSTPPPSSRGSFDLVWTPRPKVTNGTEVKART